MEKIKLILNTGLIVWGLNELQAQDKMDMNLKNNTQTVYALSNVKNITFPTGQVSVNKTDGQKELQFITAIKNIQFERTGGPLSIVDNKNLGNSTLSLYPNPLNEEVVKVQYELPFAEPVHLELLNVNGKLEKQIYTQGIAGINEIQLNVQELMTGIYICRISTDHKVSTGKIIKY